MNLLIDQAVGFQDFVIGKGWDFYFIGGLAVQIWGEPRLTRDIDITIFTNLNNESAFIETVLSEYRPKLSDPVTTALTERLLPVLTQSGITIDILLSGFSDMSESLARASYQKFFGELSLKVCSADDLIISKTLAGRSRDWPDIEAVLERQQNLDWDYIERSIKQLFEYEVELEEKFAKLVSLRTQLYRP